jgi:hypothetical protein
MALHKAVLAGVSAATLALAGTASAQAVVAAGAEVPIAESPGACNWNSRVSITPGLTFSPKDFAFTMAGAVGPCKMPNGETRTGTISVTKGTGSGGCGSAQVKTPFTVTWDGGRKSSMGEASGVTSGPFGFVTGKLTGGDYAGAPFETVIFLNPQGPLQCGTSGVTAAELYGQITFH